MTLTPSREPVFRPLAIAVCLAALIGHFASLYMGAASLAYFLMALGIRYRKRNRWLHRRLLVSAMGIDFSLVLLLEAQRGAVETVAAMGLRPLELGHVLASTLALTLYLPMILLGGRLWVEERPGVRRWHKWLGIITFTLRTLGFFLMFSLLGRAA